VGRVVRYSSVNNSALHVWRERERRVVFTPDFVSGELLEREFFYVQRVGNANLADL